jgi:hypothetical protein
VAVHHIGPVTAVMAFKLVGLILLLSLLNISCGTFFFFCFFLRSLGWLNKKHLLLLLRGCLSKI